MAKTRRRRWFGRAVVCRASGCLFWLCWVCCPMCVCVCVARNGYPLHSSGGWVAYRQLHITDFNLKITLAEHRASRRRRRRGESRAHSQVQRHTLNHHVTVFNLLIISNGDNGCIDEEDILGIIRVVGWLRFICPSDANWYEYDGCAVLLRCPKMLAAAMAFWSRQLCSS